MTKLHAGKSSRVMQSNVSNRQT